MLVERGKPTVATSPGQIILRLARQIALLESDALQDLGAEASTDPLGFTTIPIVVNGDSVTILVLPALLVVATSQRICVEVRREDQDHSLALLRHGTVMAAITSDARPVQGCAVRLLGCMRYRPMASLQFVRTWLPDGPTIENLARAPMVVFDRKDDLQDRYLRQRTRRPLNPPRSYVPASADFANTVRLGLGWGMLPEQQTAAHEAFGSLVAVDSEATINVSLY